MPRIVENLGVREQIGQTGGKPARVVLFIQMPSRVRHPQRHAFGASIRPIPSLKGMAMLVQTDHSNVSRVSRSPEDRAESVVQMLRNMLPVSLDLPIEAILRVLRAQMVYQLRRAMEQRR